MTVAAPSAHDERWKKYLTATFVKYDDASWHSGGDFPADLAPEAGATHIGMFAAWALLHGLAGDLHTRDFPAKLSKLGARKITPGRFVVEACDGKLTDEDLSDVGNRFAASYYRKDSAPGSYFADYAAAAGGGRSIYHVPDSWQTYDRLRRLIQQRFVEWQAKKES